MANFSFEVEERTEFGKGFARRARAAGKVPAVIYGSGKPAVHITLPAHETQQALRTPNALFEVKVGGTTYQALVKDVQRDFVTRNLEHIDLLNIKPGELVSVHVKFTVEGEPTPGNLASVSLKALPVKVDALKIPAVITANIAGSNQGDHFTVGDLQLPEGVKVELPDTHVLVAIKARAVRKTEQVDVAGGAPEEGASEEAAAE